MNYRGICPVLKWKRKMTEVLYGDRVRWECIDGPVRGEVVGFRGKWNDDTECFETYLQVELGDGTIQELGTRPSYLEMMRFKVIFRDGGWQKMKEAA